MLGGGVGGGRRGGRGVVIKIRQHTLMVYWQIPCMTVNKAFVFYTNKTDSNTEPTENISRRTFPSSQPHTPRHQVQSRSADLQGIPDLLQESEVGRQEVWRHLDQHLSLFKSFQEYRRHRWSYSTHRRLPLQNGNLFLRDNSILGKMLKFIWFEMIQRVLFFNLFLFDLKLNSRIISKVL